MARILTLLGATGLSFTALAAPQATTLSYSVDLSLIWLDALRRPEAGAIMPLAQAPQADEGAPRVLGLRRARLQLDWRTVDKAGLTLVLRPDAVNRAAEAKEGETIRELDTRAGDTAKPMPTLRLLDAYHVTLAPEAALQAGFGVYESLAPGRSAYPLVQAFGLGVTFPAKFTGLNLHWRQAAREGQGLEVDLQVFQGDADRGERVSGRDRDTFDRAPVATDAYQGGALGAVWTLSPAADLALLVGTLDAGEEEDQRRTQVFGQVAGTYGITAFGRTSRLALDLRHSRDRWRGGSSTPSPRSQASAQLTSATLLQEDLWGLVGFSYGRAELVPELATAERAAVVSAAGYQVETGLATGFGKGLALQLMLSQERREEKAPGGGQTCGFRQGDRCSATLRRVGIELSYELNANG